MMLLKIFFLIMIAHISIANPYKYEVRKTNSHVVHITTLSPKDYEIQFVKSHDSVFGRETVSHIAEREDADIAINGGFFEIGDERDGMPASTLVIDGKIFSLRNKVQAQLISKNNALSIDSRAFALEAGFGNKSIKINKYNKFPEKDDVVLYTDAWGNSTLTNYKERYEVAFDQNLILVALYEHGNSTIPQNGFILSFSKKYITTNALSPKTLGLGALKHSNKTSIVTGIPLLISHDAIERSIKKQKGAFYIQPHARTAIGLRKNGDIVLVVAEHAYKKSLGDITTNDIISAIQKHKSLMEQYKKPLGELTFNEIKELMEDIYTDNDKALGLTIPELANLMLELGCHSALNLDGGGSSTLWIDGKVVNQTIGDEDEAAGMRSERPVSDAIIFKKKRASQ